MALSSTLGLLAQIFGGDHLVVLAPLAWSPCSAFTDPQTLTAGPVFCKKQRIAGPDAANNPLDFLNSNLC